MSVLVTGGAGYIGSHACLSLIQAGYQVVAIDNLSNGDFTALSRVETLTNGKIIKIQADLRDYSAIEKVFSEHKFSSVIHFAGLKSVSESVHNPIAYYENNVSGSINLFRAMQKNRVKHLIFSSSATVYSKNSVMPLGEGAPLEPVNPYGRTKLVVEDICCDIAASDSEWSVVILRYFNPVGAHESGLIGESPSGTPNNLMPYIAKVAAGVYNQLKIFGGDYETPDGTGVRDYIHVVDLVEGHIKAMTLLDSTRGVTTLNLGTGKGFSVLELVNTFSKVTGKPVPYEIVARREGDIATSYANPSCSYSMLGWQANKTIEEMCEDVWRWQKMNPEGYKA